MTIKNYFESMPVGEVVNKRGLAYLKRMGLIWGYSAYGYLECLHIQDRHYSSDLRYLFPKGNAKSAERFDGAMYEKWRQTRARVESVDKFYEEFGCGSYIEINGVRFETKYFDGCFNAYLIKASPANGKKANHRIAMPCGVF